MFAEPVGQGWTQIVELAVALVLSALIGLEREIRRKSAGLRTHTIIGFSAALIMLVSKYGFTDVLGEHVVLDPSRVAAQIVSGIGFIGGGLIFVRRDAVRGLTTAAAVWLTTAVGMTAGAGLPVLATTATAAYFLVIYGLTPVADRLRDRGSDRRHVEIGYRDGEGVLRELLRICTGHGWSIEQLHTRASGTDGIDAVQGAEEGDTMTHVGATVLVVLELEGTGSYEDLVAELVGHRGVLAVTGGRAGTDDPDAE
ncbi:MgtC/SapB family protein [Actinomycetospora endophytica]|uniref:MgtC/SapB family protein n=1 Tax=Actinomycetospora endophytica TaxID=2291215 RepID=A0ABS8PIR6_9PSEU|nr:MgtC/SapB family protein [Actinomycetospora endophytica]MCD2198149.1 MgtC/SapB family protein [Actinomycetospora endophytica]